jgi:hypothetical protein
MDIPLELSIKMPAPEVSAAEVDALCEFLRGKGWIKAAQIEAELSINDRKLRAIAEHSDGRILSGPGCPGYKLFDGRTELIEADLAASRLESQARLMIKRAAAYRCRIHRFAR